MVLCRDWWQLYYVFEERFQCWQIRHSFELRRWDMLSEDDGCLQQLLCLSEGVSMKWWRFFWWCRWLRPNVTWKTCLSCGLWILKVDFMSGWKREIKCILRSSQVVNSLKSGTTSFQLRKKPFKYLSVPPLMRNWFGIMIWEFGTFCLYLGRKLGFWL